MKHPDFICADINESDGGVVCALCHTTVPIDGRIYIRDKENEAACLDCAFPGKKQEA